MIIGSVLINYLVNFLCLLNSNTALNSSSFYISLTHNLDLGFNQNTNKQVIAQLWKLGKIWRRFRSRIRIRPQFPVNSGSYKWGFMVGTHIITLLVSEQPGLQHGRKWWKSVISFHRFSVSCCTLILSQGEIGIHYLIYTSAHKQASTPQQQRGAKTNSSSLVTGE